MRKVCIKDCSRAFLASMANSLIAQISAGRTHNADGVALSDLLAQVKAQIPHAPEYHIEPRRN